MIKFYQTPEFLAERQVWYNKLAELGFEDIEHSFDDGNTSRFTHNWKSIDLSIEAAIGHTNQEAEYWRVASIIYWQFVHQNRQYSKLTQCVIYDYCQGETFRNMAEKYGKTKWFIEKNINKFNQLISQVIRSEEWHADCNMQ